VAIWKNGKGNIKIDLRKEGFGDGSWMELALDHAM